MGLLTTYDNSINKETSQALMITYTVTQSTEYAGYWIVTRMATKYYRYIGMTYAAAKFCAEEKVKQYTRDYARVISQPDTGSGKPDTGSGQNIPTVVYTKECKSSIAAQKTSGNMWETVIQVNEYDEKFSSTLVTNPQTLFDVENEREYDEESTGSLRITEVLWSGNHINHIALQAQGIPDFPQYGGDKLCTVQINQTYPSDNWMLMPYDGQGWVLENNPTDNMAIRCLYGPYKSNDYRLT